MLDKAERQLPTLDGGGLADYLVRLDRIDALFIELGAQGPDSIASGAARDDLSFRAEMGRWESLQEQIQNRSSRFVRLAGAAGGYPALRQEYPPATGFWWHLDAQVAMQRKRSFRRFAQTGVVVLVFLIAAAWAYQLWFAPDEATIALVGALNTIEQQVDAKDWHAALATVVDALQRAPEDPELLAWATVLSEQLNDETNAAQYRNRMLAQLNGDELQLQLLLGNDRFRAGNLEGATEAANAARALNKEEPQVYFLIGNIAEERGEIQAALEAFDRASQLAEANNPQLAVVSKMRYGFLLQRIQAGPEQTDSAPPTDATETAPLTPSP